MPRTIVLQDSHLDDVSVMTIPVEATLQDARRILSGARALAKARGFKVMLLGQWPAWCGARS